ncbi:transglycosylase domain-containing protein [Promicromonospora iranensis]|uniref:Membrane peptidoglycan carboxypeptidase n=1 Tax=Promicromonospora iranensis TaxID=1105144 RepID=A0ABU2CPA3_9MICO|nr:transglycosylase domain-containing protein [Promicromonospora iranensis]MDR7383170.1 membrane peptidoglycan carboxypeptidase [Promicromonospora iranensis]
MANWSPSPIWPQTPRRRRGIWNYPRPHRTGLRAWVPSWRVVVGTILTGMSLVVGLFTAGWIGWAVPQERPEIGSETTTVYYANDKVMGKFAAVDRTIRSLDELPPYVGEAVLASEDQNFRDHFGVDPVGMVRALVSNVTGGTRQGASTLTQQYVENTYFEPGQTSYADKFREVIVAVKVDRDKTKDEILEGYVNRIYLGRGAYGFEAAAKAYFNKPATKLTVSETAMLVGIIPSPSYWDPRFGEESRAVAEEKWARVLRNMAELGHITEEERAAATFPEPIEYKPVSRAGQVGYLLEEVRKELAGFGISEEQLMTNGYRIKTTINPKWQRAAVETANTIPYKGEGAASKRLGVSIVSVDPKDGAIRALYGGKNYEERPFNAATDGKAQPGSTFKPFTLVGALEQGHELNEYYTGNSPMQIPGWTEMVNGVEQEKELTNFGAAGSGGESFGDIDLIDATANSVNTVYAQLNVEITPEKSQDVAIRAGIPPESTNAELSNVLGTEPVRAVDLAGAYATFAAQGTRSKTHIVTSVKDGELTIHEWSDAPVQGAIDPDAMAKATYAMQKVVEEGSGAPAQELLAPDGTPWPVAGKTGSTNRNMAAWFAGYIPQLSTVVGLYQETPEGGQAPITPFGEWAGGSLTGGTWPVWAWTEYMKQVTEGMEVVDFPTYEPPLPSPSPSPSPSTSPSPSATPEDKVLVPFGLVGQRYDGVARVLAELGLRPRMVEVESDQAPGLVAGVQHENQEVKRGSDIRVEVSTGPDEDTVQVPGGLVGGDENNARNQIQRAGLQPDIQYQPSQEVGQGVVMDVNPDEGAEVPSGSPVQVIVSSGPGDVGLPTDEPTDGNGNGNGNGNGGGNP